jgi:hypothetical protein
MDLEGLQSLYQNDMLARCLFDHMASRKRNQRETKLRVMLLRLKGEGHEVGKSQLIALFRHLETLGIGRFVEGRKGWETRFVWSALSLQVSKAAQGQETDIEEFESDVEDEMMADAECHFDALSHSFHLRPDFQVELALPADFSATEAERLAVFVRSLPFGDNAPDRAVDRHEAFEFDAVQ